MSSKEREGGRGSGSKVAIRIQRVSDHEIDRKSAQLVKAKIYRRNNNKHKCNNNETLMALKTTRKVSNVYQQHHVEMMIHETCSNVL